MIVKYSAQRLPDGNTFLNCRSSLIEVDKDGKEVFRLDVPANPCIAAQRLKNGDIAVYRAAGGQPERIAVTGGFAEVSDKGLTVLAESAGA